MSQFKKIGMAVLSIVILVGVSGCGSNEKELKLTAQQKEEIAQRLIPAGKLILQKDLNQTAITVAAGSAASASRDFWQSNNVPIKGKCFIELLYGASVKLGHNCQ